MNLLRLKTWHALGIFSVLIVATGCPIPGSMDLAADSSEGETDQSAGQLAPGDCQIEVLTQGMGTVDVSCDDSRRFATLTATAADGWRFEGFEGAASTSNTIMVATGAGVTVTAVFVSESDTVDRPVDDGNDGTLIDDNGNGEDGTLIDDNGNDNGNDNINENDNDNGNDNEDEVVLLQLIVNGGVGSGTYERGTTVDVSAVIPQGQQFDKWVGDIEFISTGSATTPTIQVLMNSSVSLIATFMQAPADAQPPTVMVSIPAPAQSAPNLVKFDTQSVSITVTAEVFEGSQDQVRVFFDRDGLFDLSNENQIRDEVFIASGSSSSTTYALDISQFEKGVSYSIGALVNDGLNETLIAYASGRIRRSTLPMQYWVGSIAPPSGAPQQSLAGMILEGVNFEDNAGHDFVGGVDLTGDDDIDDFLVVARYGKPEFNNPQGIGIGEAYLVKGSDSRRVGKFNLNTIGTPLLPGLVFTGVETDPMNLSTTEGIASVMIVPNADEDGNRELVFGLPDVASDGGPFAGRALDKPGQFRAGGIVMAASQNFSVPPGVTTNLFTTGTRIQLDFVGQLFEQGRMYGRDFPVPEPENNPAFSGAFGQDLCREDGGGAFTLADENVFPDVHGWYLDIQMFQPGEAPDIAAGDLFGVCSGCVFGTDGLPETWVEPSFGFAYALADAGAIFASMVQTCGFPQLCPTRRHDVNELAGPPPPAPTECPVVGRNANEPGDILGPVAENIMLTGMGDPNASCECLAETPPAPIGCSDPSQDIPPICDGGMEEYKVGSGYYPDRIYDPANPGDIQAALMNTPLFPLGARIIGKSMGDRFGTSMTLSQIDGTTFLIASSPTRSATGDDAAEMFGSTTSSGVAYMFPMDDYWGPSNSGAVPPKPHQYVVGQRSYVGSPNPGVMMLQGGTIARPARRGLGESPANTTTIVGRENDNIERVLGISDFNSDSREDIAISAPDSLGGSGSVYIVYRRSITLEGDYLLGKLALPFTDAQRLNGALITGVAQNGVSAHFGTSLATGLDFNHDGIDDLVVGAPGALFNPNATGEVFVIFGGSLNATPENGSTIDDLIASGDAVRIRGLNPGGQFGFNVANAGDVDGDGRNDLLIAAPNASPVFDGNPFDNIDVISLANQGVDIDFDGNADDVTGLLGRPDNTVSAPDQLLNAGLVYLVLGSTNLADDADGLIAINELGSGKLPGAIFVGRQGTRGSIMGDFLGGGQAHEAAMGGLGVKSPNGRATGVAGIGDIDNDGRDDFILGSILADTRIDTVGNSVKNAGEAYVIYGFAP